MSSKSRNAEKKAQRLEELERPVMNTLGEQLVVDIRRDLERKGGKKDAISCLASIVGELLDLAPKDVQERVAALHISDLEEKR